MHQLISFRFAVEIGTGNGVISHHILFNRSTPGCVVRFSDFTGQFRIDLLLHVLVSSAE
jgi:hypothetical protein